jgi:hypothetical protein
LAGLLKGASSSFLLLLLLLLLFFVHSFLNNECVVNIFLGGGGQKARTNIGVDIKSKKKKLIKEVIPKKKKEDKKPSVVEKEGMDQEALIEQDLKAKLLNKSDNTSPLEGWEDDDEVYLNFNNDGSKIDSSSSSVTIEKGDEKQPYSKEVFGVVIEKGDEGQTGDGSDDNSPEVVKKQSKIKKVFYFIKKLPVIIKELYEYTPFYKGPLGCSKRFNLYSFFFFFFFFYFILFLLTIFDTQINYSIVSFLALIKRWWLMMTKKTRESPCR